MAYDLAQTIVADRQRELLASAAAARARRAGHPSVAGEHPVRDRLRRWFRTTSTAPVSSASPPAVAALDVPADRTSAGAQGKAA